MFLEPSGTKYFHQDTLSNRLVTSSTGTTLEQLGHFPYGESWYNSTGDKLLFTSYERDAESGNDYAMARYYVNRLGRFSSLGPLSGDTGDPQSLNRYAYTLNDPAGLSDPSGANNRLAAIYGSFNDSDEGGTDSMGTLGFFESLAASQTPSFSVIGFHINDGSYFDSSGWQTLSLGDAFALSGSGDEPLTFLGSTQMGGDFSLESSAFGGGVQIPLRPRDQAAYNKNKARLVNNLLSDKKCRDFLRAHGIDPDALEIAVETQQPWNSNSTITLGDAGITYGKGATDSVRAFFANPQQVAGMLPGVTVDAVAQTPGNNAYYRSGSWIFSASSVSPGNIGHESIHNLYGTRDIPLQRQLGLPAGGASSNISQALIDNGCTK
jgi:RHS repeat-associated protein